jgi:hypothetical protein
MRLFGLSGQGQGPLQPALRVREMPDWGFVRVSDSFGSYFGNPTHRAKVSGWLALSIKALANAGRSMFPRASISDLPP